MLWLYMNPESIEMDQENTLLLKTNLSFLINKINREKWTELMFQKKINVSKNIVELF